MQVVREFESHPFRQDLKRPDGGMVYTVVLEATAERHGGSSPLLGTKFEI